MTLNPCRSNPAQIGASFRLCMHLSVRAEVQHSGQATVCSNRIAPMRATKYGKKGLISRAAERRSAPGFRNVAGRENIRATK
jgi:hypothetical protein